MKLTGGTGVRGWVGVGRLQTKVFRENLRQPVLKPVRIHAPDGQ